MIGSTIIGITSNKNSTVAQKVDVVQIFEDVHEACHLGLAPTTSTTIAMVYGDALAVTVSILKGFDKKDFGLLHPAGSLGKRLTIRAVDLMHAVPTQQILHMDSFLSDALMVMIESGMEIITISDEKEKIIGIIDEKTIKSALISGIDIYSQTVSCYIRKFPIFMDVSAMAIDALTIMNENDLTSIPIVNEERVIGIIKKTDILKVGICQ
jgi:arabinose-5-phosphate isomerase